MKINVTLEAMNRADNVRSFFNWQNSFGKEFEVKERTS